MDMHRLAILGALSSSLALVALPREADACGGTFCDGGGGPQTMPVDQTGENILFVMGGSYTEAHIQIQYDPNTEAAEFAWIVPMTALPEFTVGCDAFFDNMLAATVPVYGFNTQQDNCGPATSTFGSTAASSASGGDGGGSEGGADGTGGGPNVVLQETVGAFDITVLSGGTAAEVMTWLGDNGYNQDPNAEPILQEYLDESYLFAAFKLTNGADVAEIHPIVLTFQQDEACVPIRLTRIAAQEDMEIRTFFLADNRVVPSTYKHVLVNPLRLDWPNLASNYKEIITLAVDAFEAEGKAFVTEYASSSAIVPTFGIWDASWDAGPFATMQPVDVIDTLGSQGLVYCYPGGGEFSDGGGGTMCEYNHALLRGILNQYIPVPVGITEVEFYGCLSCYEAMIDAAAWDGPAFAMAMQQRIIDPGAHALEVLGAFPFLTRMYTTISPAEMTADPFFYQNPDLDEVDLTSQIGTRRILCNNDNLWTLPDGREVYVPQGAAWPAFDDEMPYEQEVQEMPAQGPPIGLVDNSALIQAELVEYNCQFGWPSGSACGGDGTGTSGDTDVGSGSGSGSGGADGDGGGCGCTTDRAPSSAALFGLAMIGLARRRRRA
jgi:MYXO-CTERM domain-containing protein